MTAIFFFWTKTNIKYNSSSLKKSCKISSLNDSWRCLNFQQTKQINWNKGKIFRKKKYKNQFAVSLLLILMELCLNGREKHNNEVSSSFPASNWFQFFYKFYSTYYFQESSLVNFQIKSYLTCLWQIWEKNLFRWKNSCSSICFCQEKNLQTIFCNFKVKSSFPKEREI